MLVFCNDQSETQVLDLISQIKKETQLLLSDLEVCQIYATVKKTEKIPGAIAEVGVYKGGSAKIIREVTRKPLYLFETFEGLPDLSESDDPNEFQKGKYSATFEGVKNYLKDYSDVYLYKGFFPSTADPIKDKMFSFVHLDVDIYESTSNCLKFFYPRMSKGRIILSHDYPSSKGVKKAFDEFFEDKPEIVIDLPVCGQCLVVKL
jgi:O-methyltransferase